MNLQPTYYVKHPDNSFSEADPQPALATASPGTTDQSAIANTDDPGTNRTMVLVPKGLKCHKCGAAEPWKDPTRTEVASVVDDPKTWEGIEKTWPASPGMSGSERRVEVSFDEPPSQGSNLAFLRDLEPQPLPDYCFECDDTSRCASAETCYAHHEGYPKRPSPAALHPSGQGAPATGTVLLFSGETIGDPERFPDGGYITFASVEDRKKCELLLAAIRREARVQASEKEK